MTDLFDNSAGKEIVLDARDIEVVEDKGFYWDIARTWKRNAVFNFITGTRGVGKTYGAVKQGYKDWLERGSTMMYLRRKQNEGAPGMLLDKHINDGTIKELVRFDKGIYWLCRGSTQETNIKDTKPQDWQIFCYTAAISTARKKKSNPYINCKLIVLDEFISEVNDYLCDEPERLIGLCETVFRGDDDGTRVYCLANGYSIYNPYFLYFKIAPDETSKNGLTIFRDKKRGFIKFIIEQVNAEEFIQHRKTTRFGSIIQDTEYGNFMLDNKAIGDEYKNIGDFSDGKVWKKSELYRICLGDNVWSVMLVRDRRLKNPVEKVLVCKAANKTITPDTYDIGKRIIAGRKHIRASNDIRNWCAVQNAVYAGELYYDTAKTASILNDYFI